MDIKRIKWSIKFWEFFLQFGSSCSSQLEGLSALLSSFRSNAEVLSKLRAMLTTHLYFCLLVTLWRNLSSPKIEPNQKWWVHLKEEEKRYSIQFKDGSKSILLKNKIKIEKTNIWTALPISIPFDIAVVPLGWIICNFHTALNSGSSKQGTIYRARAGSIWVIAINLNAFKCDWRYHF